MVKKLAEFKDAVYTLEIQTRINGELKPKELINMKFRKPNDLYMLWIEKHYKGREIIYVPEWDKTAETPRIKNNSKVLIHEGGRFNIATWSIDVLRLSQFVNFCFPITEPSIRVAVVHLLKEVKDSITKDELDCSYNGITTVEKRKTYFVKIKLPKDKGKGYSFYRADVFIDKDLQLPIKVVKYGFENEIDSIIIHRNLRIDVGLTDYDFDPANKDYTFM